MENNSYIKNIYTKILSGSILGVMAIMCTGCTLASSESVNVIYAPQVHTSFENDPNAIYYKNSRYFIYKDNNLLIRDTILNYENAKDIPDDFIANKSTPVSSELSADKESQIIFKGLPEGDYNLVTFHNADNCEVVNTQVGISTSSELRVVPPSISHLAIDNVFSSSGTVKLALGDKTLHEVKGIPMFYKINITLTGVDEMTSPPAQPHVVFENIRKHFTCDGISDVGEIGGNTDKIELTYDSDGALIGTIKTNKFFDGDRVMLKLYEAEPKGLVGRYSISPSDLLDVNSSDLPVLDLKLKYENHKFWIYIADWILLEQDASVGG